MQKGNIGVTTENIFPIIKKFLYSDHEIFLRELVSNAVDATQKLKTLASVGEFKGELGDLTVRVKSDKKTLTIFDRGVGMTAEEIDQYINQIAFSGAEEFLKKYKKDAASMIGHFGLGFYSSFMVAKKVEIITKSYKDDAKAVKWSCEGTPEYKMEETDKADRGTDIILYIDDENKEFLEESRITQLLKKYCRFLPVEISFGKQKEWKDGKQVDTDKDNIVNEIRPAWTRKPSELTEEDYKNFYRDLYPMSEEPLFWIHLNVDYPFNLTGILYFPKIKNNLDVQRNKIQLYCNQVFVTDSVEGVVPEFLTLLNGVIDSPDIPLNVSRSYLQSDANVKKISGHITKKVSDRLQEIFNNDRKQFEEKWDDLKIFIEYGMLSDEKFYDRAEKFALLKNVDGLYFTFEEYRKLIKESQTDKDGQLVFLYTNHKEEQYSYIDAAKSKGYDVLLMDGQLDIHFVGLLEQKFGKSRFTRIDSDVVDNLIPKEKSVEVRLSNEQRDALQEIFKSQVPNIEKTEFVIGFEALGENAVPVLITRNEFLRRMKDMAAFQPGFNFYGEMPDSYTFVVNSDHALITNILKDEEEKCAESVTPIHSKLQTLENRRGELQKAQENKKDEEIPVADKEELKNVQDEITGLKGKQQEIYDKYASGNQLVRQLIDLALLSNNMLKGEALSNFIKRSISLI
ncbi:MAG: molecular chaperone HtpG [Candidatus Azobacteroides sp.]|nr:molecular chaperone HtpG [Candidatus Azobacteroides sp.]